MILILADDFSGAEAISFVFARRSGFPDLGRLEGIPRALPGMGL